MLGLAKKRLRNVRAFVSSYALTRVQSRAQAKGQRSIVVVAARRSGHHAVILWLANSLEGSRVEWEQLGKSQSFLSSSRRTLHLNNWTLCRAKSASWQGLRVRHILRSSDHLFVNYEDVDPLVLDRRIWLPIRPDLKVVIRRSTLNVVASRMKMAEAKPTPFGFPVDQRFLDLLLSYRRELSGWLVIDFDSWLRDEDGYRARIAERAGVTSGDDPQLSGHGGGSSFTGLTGLPRVSELTNRFTQVDWPEQVVALLLDDRYSSLLTPEERDFLQSRHS